MADQRTTIQSANISSNQSDQSDLSDYKLQYKIAHTIWFAVEWRQPS